MRLQKSAPPRVEGLPDLGGVEAAVVDEGAIFDEVREDGAHRPAVARGLQMKRKRMDKQHNTHFKL